MRLRLLLQQYWMMLSHMSTIPDSIKTLSWFLEWNQYLKLLYCSIPSQFPALFLIQAPALSEQNKNVQEVSFPVSERTSEVPTSQQHQAKTNRKGLIEYSKIMKNNKTRNLFWKSNTNDNKFQLHIWMDLTKELLEYLS